MIYYNKFDRIPRRKFLRNPFDSSEDADIYSSLSKINNYANPNEFKYFIISPYKKSSDVKTNLQNIQKFENTLIVNNFEHYKQMGFYMGDAEPSFIVRCSLKEAIRFGNIYNQESIIGFNYDNDFPSISKFAVYIDLKSRSWELMRISQQIRPMSMSDFFFKKLEGSYIFHNKYYYIYTMAGIKDSL
jgi:hypothetical protein